MKTKTLKSKAIYSLSALFAVVFMFCITLTSTTLSASADTNLSVLFDGTNSSATIPTADTNVDGIKVNIVGTSEMQSISNGFTLDDITYYKAIKTGGKSSAARYFSFTVPETVKHFVVKIVAAPNGSEAAKFSLSTESSILGSDDEVFFTTGTSSSTYTAGISSLQTVTEETTYYLNFSASARIAYVAISPTAEEIVDSSSTQNNSSLSSSSVIENSGLSSYSDTSAVNGNINSSDLETNNRNTIAIIQMFLGVLLVVLIIVGIVSIIKNNRKKKNDDWFDYLDDFDDFDE